ncbi:uncharacterized protein VTP21DRAFT_10259 [Calcarisporiella thermophila]|uniref:uncharacterized protein n=1 Tax=Calcarisporiella thermophila TaxID=911321 RepID=UPI0037448E4C
MNANGLPQQKFRILSSLIPSHYDIIFIAETWYVDYDAMLQHPATYLHTPFPSYRDYGIPGRQHGGLLAMVDPRLHPQITQNNITEYSILFTLNSIRICGVYFPPNIPRHLPSQPAVIMGDINTKFDGRQRGPLERIDLFCDYVAKWSLSPLTLEAEEKGRNMVDHTFVHSDLVMNVNYSAIDPPVDTDHLYLLQLVVEIPVENNAFRGLPSQASIPRYYLKYLEDAPTLRLFQSTYSHLTRTLTQPLANLATFFANSQPEEAQEVIEEAEGHLLHAIQLCAESILGTYRPQERRQDPDHLFEHLKTCRNTHDALRALKRAQRVNGMKGYIQSKDPAKSPMEEAREHYSRVFQYPIGVQDDSPPPLPLASTLERKEEVASFFSSIDIIAFIRSYPQQKSCGADAIHTKLLMELQRDLPDSKIK